MQPTPKSISAILYGIDGILQNIQEKRGTRPSIREFMAVTTGNDEKNKLIRDNVARYGKKIVNDAGMINMPTNKSFINAWNAVSNVLSVCLMNKDEALHADLAKKTIKDSIKLGFEAISQTATAKNVLDNLENLMRENVKYAFEMAPEVGAVLLAESEQEYCLSVKNDIMENWLGSRANDAANDLSV